jgi:hypothetical protein
VVEWGPVFFRPVAESDAPETANEGASRSALRMPEFSSVWRELIAVVLLRVSTIATAWSGFLASKWGGEMSISFCKASAARIEALRADGNAHRQLTVQVQLSTQWIATDPQNNPDAVATPGSLPVWR